MPRMTLVHIRVQPLSFSNRIFEHPQFLSNTSQVLLYQIFIILIFSHVSGFTLQKIYVQLNYEVIFKVVTEPINFHLSLCYFHFNMSKYISLFKIRIYLVRY